MSDKDDSTTEPDDADTDPVDDATGDPDGAEQLGDAGKKALDSMKARLKKTRDERNALADQVAKLQKGEGEQPDPVELRKQAQAEARAEVARDRALDKVETRAAKLFADPEDARALLAGQVDDFLDDGQVDADAIDEALEKLLKKKPHLAAAKAEKRFAGGGDGGARKGTTPAQVSEQDLKRMTPDQIVKAREEGRLADLMGAT